MKNVLILNRGEIALRAIDSCKRLNLKSFCLVNDCEGDTLVAKTANKIIKFSDGVNPFMSLEIIERVIEQYQIEVLYPGYGFLSEDPRLRELCDSKDVVFIGPNTNCLERLSSKKESFEFAKKSKLKVLKIENPAITDFPLMIKASFGGGGRGNVICQNIEDYNGSLLKLKARASELFHNDDYLLERYLPNARHVELQFVACAHKVYFLGTRDCSVQMKFQKFLEEGPSDDSSSKYIEELYTHIERSLLEMKYEGVGTIEFLWDYKDAYFMEVNTRIQVEHPVTEFLYDINLVDIQFLIALDSDVKFNFQRSKKHFHSICARIYAVDTACDFIPAPAKLELLSHSKLVRFDSHFQEQNSIPMQFDPLIGKLIVGGADRMDCIKNLKKVLTELTILIDAHNISFIAKLLEDQTYLSDKHNVSYIENHFLDKYTLSDYALSEEELEFIWNKNQLFQEEKFLSLVYKEHRYEIYRFLDILHVFRRDRPYMERVSLNEPFWTETKSESENISNSPITGRVVSVHIEENEEVKQGQTLFILEAMKTQITIFANSDFTLKSLLVTAGSIVTKNQRLFEVMDKGQ